ncbi:MULTISPECIES: DUF397 domain-containing protein [unclassified Streptomyces]|uniref:DUF397 domain-containing protein n=1 Tax=unclassified Streptomyces TaxID=2593676 RepID=UPI000DACAEAB|nr:MULTISPECIES: DUF397 domain-containing protein [unclassified Streptomyces]PZT76721.1 DUF397 domain-containing protein [Streptomyces sp. AC1-42W]PZT79324.1 DUF397 domain-containing protein [Streptomyces sp. AC1-42T]
MTHTNPIPTEDLAWAKSSYSGNQGNCVEVAGLPGGGRAVRDSKDTSGPFLAFTETEWRAFINGTRTEGFNA